MKKIIFAIAFISISAISFGQEINTGSSYQTAVGIKVYPGALDIKHFIKPKVAIEGLAYIWQYGFRTTGLYEIHGNINSVEGLKYYIGGGAHLGFYNTKWNLDYPSRQSGLDIGVDGVLGLDYKIPGAPIDVSFDWQPSIDLIGYNNFESGWGGLAIRYTF
ncbi:hypothetical protein GALL_172170 [mine drainage metagenome]|uniref:Outer membrane protein beta-barrel domain-containing protein n=1 Tax=mine drainage metagenome TaxID=410659 RepID=A0A1J5SG58_9ZZZZ